MMINFGSKVINSKCIVAIRKSTNNYTSGRIFNLYIDLINNYNVHFEFKTRKKLQNSFNKLMNLVKVDNVIVEFPISDKDLENLNDEIVKCPTCNKDVSKSSGWWCCHCGVKIK